MDTGCKRGLRFSGGDKRGLTSTSSSVKLMTVRAFLTTFQSFLSLMEETLAHWPWRRAKLGCQPWRCAVPGGHLPCPPATHLHQVQVALGVAFQAQPAQRLLFAPLQQLIENVEVPLPVVLVDHAGLLQEVTENVASHRGTLRAGRNRGTTQGDGEWGPSSLLSPPSWF